MKSIIIKLLKSLNYKWYFKLYNLIWPPHYRKKHACLIKSHGLKSLAQIDVNKYKSSDTLFILGSGSSVNDYGKEEWKHINKHDSIGFNFWFYHPFVPTYYVFEPAIDEEDAEKFVKNLNYRKEDYMNVPFIMKDVMSHDPKYYLEHLPSEVLENLYLSFDYPIAGDTNEEFSKSLDLTIDSGAFNNYSLEELLRKRASISYLVLLGMAMGYQKIILCGVDLNNSNYFFEGEGYSSKEYFDYPYSNLTNKVHLTVDKEINKVTIDYVIKELDERVLKPRGTNLYIGSKKSLLYPSLPYYNFDRS